MTLCGQLYHVCPLLWLNCFQWAGPGPLFPIQMEAVCRLVNLIQLWSVGTWASLGHLIAVNDSTGMPEQ